MSAIETVVTRMGSGGDGIAPWPGDATGAPRGDATGAPRGDATGAPRGDATGAPRGGATGAPRDAALPLTLPGERVRARAAGRRGDLVLAEAEAILDPSADRVAPPCGHFGACGGCALQHWADAPYRAWKRGRLVQALEHAGFPDAAPRIGNTVASPPRSRRRADLALRRNGAGVAIGFHARGDARVVDMRECHVLDPRLFALVAPLREALPRLAALRREGSALLNLLDTGPDLLLRTDAPLSAADRRLLAAFAASQGLPRISWALNKGPPETAAQTGPVALTLGGVSVSPAPGAFLQATPQGEAAIVGAVLDGLPERLPPRARLLDLFAGLGTLTFPLAGRARVEAFEAEAEAVNALSAASGRVAEAGLRGVTARRRDLARQPLTPAELAGAAALVLDPPYAGAPETVAALARSTLERAVYVSCNPAALSRDAAVLARAGWELLSATPVDQFLWSPHLEAVVAFGRAAPARSRPAPRDRSADATQPRTAPPRTP